MEQSLNSGESSKKTALFFSLITAPKGFIEWPLSCPLKIPQTGSIASQSFSDIKSPVRVSQFKTSVQHKLSNSGNRAY